MSGFTHLLRFGAGERVYNFPQLQGDYGDTFGSGQSYIVSTAGMDGGIDQLRGGAAPAESGIVRAEITLVSPTRAGMTALRDSLKTIRRWGVQRLTMQASDTSGEHFPAERYCWAKVLDVPMPEDRGRHTDLWQPVQPLLFEVPDPRWLSWGDMEYWGDGSAFDDAGDWPGPRISETINDATEIILENKGSTITPVLVRIFHAANAVDNLTLQLLGESGETLTGFRFHAPVGHGDMLIVDAGLDSTRDRVVYDLSTGIESGWPHFEIVGGVGFVYLEPGDNRLLVTGDFDGNMTLEAEWSDAWS